jgi:hypothetical protein
VFFSSLFRKKLQLLVLGTFILTFVLTSSWLHVTWSFQILDWSWEHKIGSFYYGQRLLFNEILRYILEGMEGCSLLFGIELRLQWLLMGFFFSYIHLFFKYVENLMKL